LITGFKTSLALVVLSSLVLSGCAGVEAKPQISRDYPSEFSKYYEQEVSFETCGTKLYCADIEVPMNWEDAEGEAISIAVVYRQAGNTQSNDFLLFNPGGPGVSGFDWVKNSSEFLGTKNLRQSYNLVGFDPRGVGRSSAVRCLENEDYDDFLYGVSGFELGSNKDIEFAREEVAKFTESCTRNTGELLAFVDTVSAARDMDVIRVVLGQEKLNYLGYSYGSFLGTTYANLYPSKVGRFVLDGAIDPTATDSEQTRFQLVAFEESLRSFLKSCSEFSDCPFTSDVEESLLEIGFLLKSIEAKPLSTSSGRQVTIWALITGLIMPLYSESYWPALSTAFSESLQGKGDTFLYLADFYNDRDQAGNYTSNLIPANYAISCLDSRADSSMSAMLEENQRLLESAPLLGRYWQFAALRCEQWPHEEAKPLSNYSAKGAETILVIGTTGDPATPYSQAVSLAKSILEKAVLLTYQGEGHTIYGQNNACINQAVDEFFLRGKIPEADKVCSD
jgi:pimeloyl-ACP methyl ester carboxylesterase